MDTIVIVIVGLLALYNLPTILGILGDIIGVIWGTTHWTIKEVKEPKGAYKKLKNHSKETAKAITSSDPIKGSKELVYKRSKSLLDWAKCKLEEVDRKLDPGDNDTK